MKNKMQTKNQLNKIVVAAVISALYVALTAISSTCGLSYFGVQLRISEALTILPVFSPYAITGLTLGCFIVNLASPLGIVDIIFGTLSTFLAACVTRCLAHVTIKGVPILAPFPPVFIGAMFIGTMLSFLMPQGFSFYVFAMSAISVGVGQFIACYVLGIPLFFLVRKLNIFENSKF